MPRRSAKPMGRTRQCKPFYGISLPSHPLQAPSMVSAPITTTRRLWQPSFQLYDPDWRQCRYLVRSPLAQRRLAHRERSGEAAAPGGHIAHDSATQSLLRRALIYIRYFLPDCIADFVYNPPRWATRRTEHRNHLAGRYQLVKKLPHKISQRTQLL